MSPRRRKPRHRPWLIYDETQVRNLGPTWESEEPRPHLWLEVPLEEGWVAHYRLAALEGCPVVAELRVFFRDPSEPLPKAGLSARLLRKVSIRADVGISREIMAELHAHWGEDVWAAEALGRYGLTAAALRSEAASRPGRRGHDDRFYATIALDYDRRIRSGSRRPVADLASKLNLSPATVGGLVHKARRRGFLTASPPGQPGGSATPRASEASKARPRDDASPSAAGLAAYEAAIQRGASEDLARAEYVRAVREGPTDELRGDAARRAGRAPASRGPGPRWCPECDGSVELIDGVCGVCGWSPAGKPRRGRKRKRGG